MKRKSLTIILMVPFLLCSFLLSQISSTYALENETISDPEYSELQYEIIKDNETERVVHYLDSSSEGTVTFDKKTKNSIALLSPSKHSITLYALSKEYSLASSR